MADAERIAEQIARMKAQSQQRRDSMRKDFPDVAQWVDEYREVFPGCKFKNFTLDGKPL